MVEVDYSTLDYNTIAGSKDKRTDMKVGADYSYYLSKILSVGAGIDFSNFKKQNKAWRYRR